MGIWLFLLIFLTINVARFISVYLVSSAINSHRQKTIISSIYQFMMWFSGFRGAMAFALALKAREIFKENKIGDIILTFTLIVSTINVIFFFFYINLEISAHNMLLRQFNLYLN